LFVHDSGWLLETEGYFGFMFLSRFIFAKVIFSNHLQMFFCPFNFIARANETNDEEFDTIAYSYFYFYL